MFCIDVSASMGRTRTVEVSGGEDGEAREVEMTNLEWSAQYVLLKVQEMVRCGCSVYLLPRLSQKNGDRSSTGAKQTSAVSFCLEQKVSKLLRYVPILF